MSHVLQQTGKICSWFENFRLHIDELSESFVKCEILYRNILLNTSLKIDKGNIPYMHMFF